MLFETLEDYDKAIAESDERLEDLEKRYKRSRDRQEKAEQNRVTAITNRLKEEGYPVTICISTYGYTYTYLHLGDKIYHISSYLKSKSEDENYCYLKQFIQMLTSCHNFITNPDHKITWTIGEMFSLNTDRDSIYISENTGGEKYNERGLEHTIVLKYDIGADKYSLTLQTETETRSKRYFDNHYPITKDISLVVSSFYHNDTLILRHETTQPTSLKTLDADFYHLLKHPNPFNQKET